MRAWTDAVRRRARDLVRLVVGACAIFLSVLTLGAMVGLGPWIDFYASYGGVPLTHAGVWAQAGLTLLMVTLALFLPSGRSMDRLENRTQDAQASASRREAGIALFRGRQDALDRRYETLARARRATGGLRPWSARRNAERDEAVTPPASDAEVAPERIDIGALPPIPATRPRTGRPAVHAVRTPSQPGH
ncbi:hypothetical protein [Maritimibacter sp. DP1N21-5]|uniref:hypothetical protein n=1 Tax=Maritimibacter sp. DP1N21-5 TaxID=2836867 RepID=UPI001C457CED|nr:hypothetical protein [Maritimibacter sp. DP1N21-5]